MWEAGTKVRVKPGAIDRTVTRFLSYGTIYTIRGIYENYPGEGQLNNYVTLVSDDTGEVNPNHPWDPERRFELVEPVVALESVYVYVAYMRTTRNRTHTCSHQNEEAFKLMIEGYEHQGNTILAKKRIKINV